MLNIPPGAPLNEVVSLDLNITVNTFAVLIVHTISQAPMVPKVDFKEKEALPIQDKVLLNLCLTGNRIVIL